jgi:hypothetical protein
VQNISRLTPYDAPAATENCGTRKDAMAKTEDTKMLDLGFDDWDMMIWVAPQQAIFCDACGQEASIFQEEGNFCLDCWQERTEPYITVNRAIEA